MYKGEGADTKRKASHCLQIRGLNQWKRIDYICCSRARHIGKEPVTRGLKMRLSALSIVEIPTGEEKGLGSEQKSPYLT